MILHNCDPLHTQEGFFGCASSSCVDPSIFSQIHARSFLEQKNIGFCGVFECFQKYKKKHSTKIVHIYSNIGRLKMIFVRMSSLHSQLFKPRILKKEKKILEKEKMRFQKWLIFSYLWRLKKRSHNEWKAGNLSLPTT